MAAILDFYRKPVAKLKNMLDLKYRYMIFKRYFFLLLFGAAAAMDSCFVQVVRTHQHGIALGLHVSFCVWDLILFFFILIG